MGLWLGAAALAGGLVGCGSSPPAREAPVQPRPPLAADEPQAPPAAVAVAMQALGLVGTPYRYGGNTPDSGFDCSGLIAYVHLHAAGQRMPRTVAELALWGREVQADERRTGDVVVFGPPGRATHAGIYVGGGRFVHAPSTGGTVRLDRLDGGHWARQGARYRRAGP